MPRGKQLLCFRGEHADGLPNGAVHQTGGDLIDGIVDLVKVVSAVLQSVIQKLEIFRSRISRLRKFTSILRKIIAQLIGLIQPVLGTHHDIIHGFLCRQAILLHERIDTTESFIHVNPIQFLQRDRLLGQVGEIRFTQIPKVLFDHQHRIGHSIHALAHTGGIHVFDHVGGLFRCLSGLAKVSVHLGHGILGIGIGIQRLISDLLNLIAHGRQLIRRLHQSSAFGIFRNLTYVIRCIFRSVSGFVQLLDQVLDGLPVIHGIQSVRQLADIGFPSCGRLPDLLKGCPQLVRIRSPVFDSRSQPAAKDIRIIVYLCSRSGEQLFQPCGILGEGVLLCLQIGKVCLIFVQLPTGFLNLPLERLILIRPNIPTGKGCGHLLLCGFQSRQFFFRLAYRLSQQFLLLRHQHRIGRIEF